VDDGDAAAGGLIRGIARGDRGAFATLYDAERIRTWALCRRRFVDSAEAGTAMERLWLRIWTHAPAFEQRALSDRAAVDSASFAVLLSRSGGG
jgi:DNA-directed RNA polymerase specialized sigma24 family protein